MNGFKTYRHESNPKEKELHDKFIEHVSYNEDDIDRIVFPPSARFGDMVPGDYLNPREKQIVISTIQWLGSPVGQKFLERCGFVSSETQE